MTPATGHNTGITPDAPATKFAKDQLKAIIERVERMEEELLDGSWLGESGGAVADADGGEVGELVEDLAAGGSADAFLEESPFLGLEGSEPASYLSFNQPVEEQREADHGEQGGDAAV